MSARSFTSPVQSRRSRVTAEGESVGRPTNRYVERLDDDSLANYLLALSRQRGVLNAKDPMQRGQALEVARMRVMGLFFRIVGDE